VKSRLLNLVAVLHSELNIMKSRNSLGTKANVITSAQHSVVLSVTGKANSYAAIFHSVIIILCRWQSSARSSAPAVLLYCSRPFQLVLFPRTDTVPLTPTYGFTQLRMKNAWLAQRLFSVREKAGSPDCIAGLGGCCLFLLSVKTHMPCISDRKPEALFLCQSFFVNIFVPTSVDIHLLSLIPGTCISLALFMN